ncbi:hypothetical protein PrebiDRAFT_2072 [Prevotella bivia DSM 20514]|uniref:Uncharacterized protein n=1 Tax=Prevotella bivia DSM 20514 TaxID=868129 RepID=I4ZBZ6_9BACT|nr:hypothetical protein PrebiDRAFT_2072 [Prevotella bivia DSM 20514]
MFYHLYDFCVYLYYQIIESLLTLLKFYANEKIFFYSAIIIL